VPIAETLSLIPKMLTGNGNGQRRN